MRRNDDFSERRLDQLRVLSTTAEALARGMHRSSSEILEIVYQQASKLIDTDNMYIALYDETTNTIRLGLAFVEGKRVDIERREEWQPRHIDKDKIAKIIRAKKPLFHTRRAGADAYYEKLQREEHVDGGVWASWLGVPMIVGERVLGIITIYHPAQDHVYGEDDLEILQAIADQAAIALDNVRLSKEQEQVLRSLREEQKRSRAAERLAAVSTVAAGFVHRLNNVAGTIPVRVEQIKEMLDPDDPRYPKINHFLDAINKDIDGILRTARAMRVSTGITEPLESVSVALLISSAVERIAVPAGVTICIRCDEDLPEVLVVSGKLIDALENLIRNGIEAIESSGSVTITGRMLVEDGQDWVAIEIEDTGRGISPKDLPRIFDMFFSTKGGMGFGLWGARALIESLGGKITVSSEVGKGTVFTIFLPVAKSRQINRWAQDTSRPEI